MSSEQAITNQASSSSDLAEANGTSPELTGGQGFSFEDAVAATYAAALLAESTAPGLPGRVVTHISVQQGSFGQPLDDLIVCAVGADQVSMTFSAQVKRALTISAARSNEDFREIIEHAFDTLSLAGFQQSLDRVGAIVGEISDASKRNFETLCEWARAESSSNRFLNKLQTEGAAGNKRTQYEAVRDILSTKVAPRDLDATTHRLLVHFVLIRLDLITEGSPDEARTVAALASTLTPSECARADDLWRRLLALVRVSQGRAASFDRKTLVARLNGAFRLSGAPSSQGSLQAIAQESRLAAADIVNGISGLSVPRDKHVHAILDAIQSPGFVQIGGMPGAGKSVVLRTVIEQLAAVGPVLFLKSDRLRGSTWGQYAAAAGISHGNLEELLVDIAAAGSSVLFVDGIDRIEVEHRGVVLDLFNTIHTSSLLSCWRVVATVRDTGMESLRTWLPAHLVSAGMRTLTVKSFDDEEAETLANAKPALRPLLFGSDAVRTVVRRPFFAAVLAKEVGAAGNTQATSEVDLAALWWERSGYAADPARVGYRRNAIVQLAKTGAHQLGRRIPIADIDAQVLTELEVDGIIRSVRGGHTVQFSHDIFFEWAFLQHLIRAEDNWPNVIHEVGEPPALGRVVELLSQSELVHEENWAKYLILLESNKKLRSQWLRAWLAGPFSLETFAQYSSAFNRAVFDAAHDRVRKLVVWYQAEKTQPNTNILERTDVQDLDLAKRMLYADMLGYPSDVAAWARFCNWLLDHAAELPTRVIPDVVAAFGVWQNMFFGERECDRVSERIVQTCLAWLYHIEHQTHQREVLLNRGVWQDLDGGWGALEELESSLRSLALNASLAQRTLVTHYVRDLGMLERMPRGAVQAVFMHAPYLARGCPAELVDFTLSVVRKRLPTEVKREMRCRDYLMSHSFGHFEWDHLSIDDQFSFFPAAPTREPFHSLLEQSPDQGRRLIRELANHAIRAWRQLHRLSCERDGTPIPLILVFPWGTQVFWGDSRLYQGARGSFGPAAVNTGWMALEAWAFRQLEKNAPVDDVLRAVLEGHKSVGALAVAAAVALQARHSSATSLPIAISQRLWHWDIQRKVQDMVQVASLIGFLNPNEGLHALAVKAGNDRPVRRLDIRSLATLMLLEGGDIGEQAAAAIQRFPYDLPFDYAEERKSTDARADLSRTAEIWAELGKKENYRAERSEDKSKMLISVDNPKATGPDIEETQARNAEMSRHLTLLNWAYAYFHEGTLKKSLTVDEAVHAAKDLDDKALFAAGHEFADPAYQRQSAVASIAAIVVQVKEEAHLEWAVDVCTRASRTPEIPQQFFGREATLMHHPVLYAVKGLAACFDFATRCDKVKVLQTYLTELSANPYEEIAVEALKGLLNVWSTYPDIAWAAVRLATEISLVEVRYGAGGDTQATHYQRIQRVITTELERLETGAPVPPVPTWPEPWLSTAAGEAVNRSGRKVDVPWRVNPLHVNTSFLEKVLDVIPVDTAVADQGCATLFLDWCEGLVKWTIQRIAPSWADNPRDVDDQYGPNYYEWQHRLYRFLARVSLRLSVSESTRRFLEPAMATEDETFGGFAESFSSHLMVQIAHSRELPPVAIQLLSVIAGRVLSYRDWRYAGGGRSAERELDEIVQHLFFAEMEYAGGAVRFANGNWAEVGAVIPIFEPVLRVHGSVPFVAMSWIRLCESSFKHYPVEHFVENLVHLFGSEGTPAGWRSTQLPARLSGLIQRFGEREQPMRNGIAQKLLRALDSLVDMGDRRAAAVQLSEVFRSVRLTAV